MAARMFRTDLAEELRSAAPDAPGIRLERAREMGISYSTLTVQNEQGAEAMGRQIGRYITLRTEQIWLDEEEELARKRAVFSSLLRRLSERKCPTPRSIFVACLGNAALTADALGPMVQSRLRISRHLRTPALRSLFPARDLSALSPGVTGQTGIETAALIDAAVGLVKPDLVIAVDALCARSPDRLCTTVQLCDSGIAPGSGIGNHRSALNEETLGVPVIAIGVPTVVDSSTLLSDAFDALSLPENEQTEALLDPDRHFLVTRKETDLAVSMLADLIAHGIHCLCSEERAS